MVKLNFLWGLSFIFLLLSCSPPQKENVGQVEVVCTTSILKDILQNILKDSVIVSSLMDEGVDPHQYVPKGSDLSKLRKASIIVYNGLHLEGKMVDALEALKKDKQVLGFSDYFPKERIIYHQNSPDPHIWFDEIGILQTLNNLKKSPLNEFIDEEKLGRYIIDLQNVTTWTDSLLANIPQKRRLLLTTHDAFSYYSRNHNFEVVSIQGTSTNSDFGLAEMEMALEVILERDLTALFLEPTVPQKFLNALKEKAAEKKHKVNIASPLYADALGPKNSLSSTYLGMLKHNSELIHLHLK